MAKEKDEKKVVVFGVVHKGWEVIMEPRQRVETSPGINHVRKGKKIQFTNGFLATSDKEVIEYLGAMIDRQVEPSLMLMPEGFEIPVAPGVGGKARTSELKK